MKNKTWVQHISGKGEKYYVVDVSTSKLSWHVREHPSEANYFLPKTQYVECDAPEEWEDVTAQVVESQTGGNWMHGHRDMLGLDLSGDYRMHKLKLYKAHPDSTQNCEQWAFVIERRKS